MKNEDEGDLGTQPLPVSVIVLTKNEESAIGDCLRSLEQFAEVFVVDSHSDDRTQEIVREHGRVLIDFSWNHQYPKKKQWSLEKVPASHEWILLLDADERVTPRLACEFRKLILRPTCNAYDVRLNYEFMGKKLRFGHKVSKRVLLRKGYCSFPEVDDLNVVNMWEVEGHYQPNVEGPIGRLKAPLDHADPDPLFTYFARHNIYSDWEAYVRVTRDVNTRLSTRRRLARLAARLPGKPFLFLVWSLIIRCGFLDGAAGVRYAIAQAFYYWQIDVKEIELSKRFGRIV